MYILSRTYWIEGAHKLEGYDGACENLHGHSWKVEVKLEGQELTKDGPKKGMLLDFHVFDNVVKPQIQLLDHKYINEVVSIQPTSENLSAWLYERIKAHLESFVTLYAGKLKIKVKSVTIWETEKSACTYEEV